MTKPLQITLLLPVNSTAPDILPLLAQEGFRPEVIRFADLSVVRSLSTLAPPDLIIIAPPAKDKALETMAAVKAIAPYAQVVLLVEDLDDKELRELLSSGAFDVVEHNLLSRLLPLLARVEQNRRLKEADPEIRRYQQTQEILNRLLHLALISSSIPDMLKIFLNEITSLPWLGLQSIGAALLVDEQAPDTLVLQAHNGLAISLQTICSRVPFGHCLCGRAAENKATVFADCIDHRHDNTYEGIKPHGHYCVPIISAEQELLGVFTLYTGEGCIRDIRVEETLAAAASVAAAIIKRLRNEEALRISEEKYRVITTTAKDAIILIDVEGHVTFWNPAAEVIFGYSAAEVLGRDLHDLLVPAKYRTAYRHGFAEFSKTGMGTAIGQTVEMVAIHKNGHEFPVEISINTLKTEKGFAAVGIVRNITKRKKIENDKALLKANLERAKNMEAIATLAGGIAHDFNNILAAIFGFAEMARDSVAADHPAHSDLDQILSGAKRAKDLVNQILIFSRQTQSQKIPVQIHLLIKEGLKLLRTTAPPSIKIRQNINNDCGAVLADPVQIHQILINLCTNAIQAMQDSGGELAISLEQVTLYAESASEYHNLPAGSYIRLMVSDTGCGMSQDIVERIFEPYFTTREVSEGSGLGLSVVHGIINNLNGAITVSSKPKEGTTFTVWFHRYIHSPDEAKVSAAKTAGGQEHIMFIDDEEALVRMGRAILSKLGYTVFGFTSGEKALVAFRDDPRMFNLVISDLTMPEMNGLEVAQEILSIRPDIPVILSTGFSETVTEQQILDMGVRKLLLKPYVTKEIGEAVRQVLDPQITQ